MILIIMFSIAIVINLILWIVLFIQLKNKFSPKVVLKSIHNDLNELITAMNQETDRDITLLEARRDGLKKLIDEADTHVSMALKELSNRSKESHVLNTLSKIADTQEQQKNTPGIQIDSEKPTNTPKRAVSSSEQQDLFELNLVQEYQPQKIPDIVPSKHKIKFTKTLRNQILELSSSGLSAEAISEKLHLSLTEVQFVVDLFGN